MCKNFIITFVFLSIIQLNNAFLNLYLCLDEVQRLLGLEAELYYVQNGTINDYALNFEVPVPSKLGYLQFTWESLVDQPPLSYSIKVETSNSPALLPSRLNISSNGLIPLTPQTFNISLLCSGTLAAEVDVNIHINITTTTTTTTTKTTTITGTTTKNLLSLTFKRKKICTKFNNQSVFINSAPTIYSNSVNIFYIAICSIVVLITIITSLVTNYYLRNNKNQRINEVTNEPIPTYITALNRSSTGYGSSRILPNYSLTDERSKDLQDRITELTIQRCRVRLKSVILEGTFGRIYLGSCAHEDGKEEVVIVKTVTDHASQVQISLLLQEGMSMYSLNHKNILSILRVSIEDHTAPFLLYPYNNYKNLKIFLQKCKLSPEGVHHTLTTQEVVDMALQIIQAIQYLHKKHLLHKDLATRNCVIDDKLKIKVADNALSRDLFPSDYYCLGDNENRPVKWLAIESLLHKTFSTMSDVWSFGVLLWELTTLAQQPYIEIDPFEMAAYLKDGYRLAQPINCPDELFAVMAYCWAMSADERPTIAQLHACLQDFYTQLIRYV